MRIEISELIKHNSLIWSSQKDVVISPSKPNIFIGGGVATKNLISKAVPFDLLGFILTAEQAKRETSGSVHMFIADQHAWLANNLNRSTSQQAAKRLKDISRRIITSCKLSNWHIHMASEVFPNEIPRDYESLELRDINHFSDQFDCGIKIGWAFSPNVLGLTDESHFDALHALQTILIKSGRTNNQEKRHESPYICTDSKSRITFNRMNDWNLSIEVAHHLRSTCSLFEHICSSFPAKTPLQDKVQSIINRIMGI